MQGDVPKERVSDNHRSASVCHLDGHNASTNLVLPFSHSCSTPALEGPDTTLARGEGLGPGLEETLSPPCLFLLEASWLGCGLNGVVGGAVVREQL